MERVSLASFVDTLVAAYKSFDLQSLASFFVVPGALYLGEEVIVWRSRKELIAVLDGQIRANINLGVVHFTGEVIAQSTSRENNYSIWVLWSHYDKTGSMIYALKSRYFCRDLENGRPIVQLVEAHEAPPGYTAEVIQSIAEGGS